jgi:hypothetical protein
METQEFAAQLQASIKHAILAHAKHAKTPRDAIRLWDKKTPYAIHPIWCAITLLTETTLPEDIRLIGYQALLWHDTLEDTSLTLPRHTKDEVKKLVEDMTFKNFREETKNLWGRSDMVKLLKLYDKVSNLLDATWMRDEKWNKYVKHTLRITEFVEGKYGELNIVKIARAICVIKLSRVSQG